MNTKTKPVQTFCAGCKYPLEAVDMPVLDIGRDLTFCSRLCAIAYNATEEVE